MKAINTTRLPWAVEKIAKMSKLISCIFVLAILSDFRNISGLRILGMFPFNVKSHSHMQQAIMKSLAARGHRVDVYTHFPLKKSIPNYHDVSLEGTLMLSVNNVTWDFCKNDVREDHLVSYLGYQQCDLMKLPMFQKLLKDPPKYDLVLVEVSFRKFHRFLSNKHQFSNTTWADLYWNKEFEEVL